MTIIILQLLITNILPLCASADSTTVKEKEVNRYDNKTVQSTPVLGEKGSILGNVQLGGWAQALWQYGGQYAPLKVGGPNDRDAESFNRFGLKMARIRTVYTNKNFIVWFQVDFSEKGVNMRDAYIKLMEDKWNCFSATLGLATVPFGKETNYPAFYVESEGKSLITSTFIPNDRDVGIHLQYTLPTKYWFDYLNVYGSLLSGNGIGVNLDNMSNVAFKALGGRRFGNIAVELGGSGYIGRVYQPTERVYTMEGNRFVCNESPANYQAYANKNAWDVCWQVKLYSPIGESVVKGEYIGGTQPGTLTSSRSIAHPSHPKNEPTNDIYIRPFRGGNIYLIHSLKNLKHTFSIKYDWYNPNTAIKGDDIGTEGTHSSTTDAYLTNISLNYFYSLTRNLRFSAHYEWIDNERTSNLSGWNVNRNDNIFTAKVQVVY